MVFAMEEMRVSLLQSNVCLQVFDKIIARFNDIFIAS